MAVSPFSGTTAERVGMAYSDDTKLWTEGWDGLCHNAGILAYACPRLSIGLKPGKVYARANDAAGDEPAGGIWILSWDEGAGGVRHDRVPVAELREPCKALGVPKPREGRSGQYGNAIMYGARA